MAKTVFETSTILYPRLDKNHWEVAADSVRSLLDENPEYIAHHWHVSVVENENGTAKLHIEIVDLKAPSIQENLGLIFWLVVIALVTAVLAYA